MRKAAVCAVVAICALLSFASVASADTAADEAAIRGTIAQMWKDVAEKNFDGSLVHPDGAIQATSAGGFWRTLSREQAASQIVDDANTLRFTPHHVQVRFLGSRKDVALSTGICVSPPPTTGALWQSLQRSAL